MATESYKGSRDRSDPGLTNQETSPPTGDPLVASSGIRTVGIVGEGKMGSGIFYSLIDSSFTLRWIVSGQADVEKLRHQFEKRARRALTSGLITEDKLRLLLSSTMISPRMQLAEDCDLVIEAIPEEVEMKRTLFKALDLATPPSTILATNSSSINPSKLFTHTNRDQAIIGIHYFYPVQLKETVEVISTDKTTREVHRRVVEFLRQSGKQILHLNESNSFILNRLFLDIQNESYNIVEAGKATEQQIDHLVREYLFAFGIFDFMDAVGLDTLLASILNYIEKYPNPDYYSGLIKRLRGLVDSGHLGVKSGKGFYTYREVLPLDSSTSPGLENRLPEEVERSLTEFLRFTYLTTAKRFTVQSGCSIDEMNRAIKEYFGMDKGPFG